MTVLAATFRRLRRAVLGRRRLLAGLCAAVAVLAALRAVTAPPPPTTAVLTAARDLPSGTVLRDADLRQVEFRPDSAPSGLVPAAEAVGRTLAGPLRAGEPVTDVRLVQGTLLDGYPGAVAAPVRIGDADAVRLLRVGDRVDLVAAQPQGSRAELVAADVPVVAIPRAGREAHEAGQGALVLVAVSDETARALAQAGVSAFISVAIRR